AQLPSLSADRRTLLILALTAKGETRILPVVMQSVQGGDQQMRILALRALKRIGDASCVDPLVDAASEESKEVAAAALETLESLQDAAVDGRLAASLDGAEGKRRLVLIELADRRRMSVAAPALWRAASDADPAVRAAAFAALGSIIDTNDLPKLLDRLPATTHDEEAAALDQALRAVSQRSEDRDVVAAQFAAALDTVDVNVKSRILESLSALGGPAALETVGAAARSNDEPLRDAATRVLGRWKSADVAPLLVDLHETVDDNRTKIRAIRAYIRVARQFDMPADERAAMCRTALRIAERYEDRRLVLEVLLRYPDEKMLSIAQEAAKIPDLRDEATLVAMAMNSKGVDRAELGRALAEAGHKPVDLEIIKAEYGAGEQKKDVTALLRKYAKSYRIIFLPSTSYNASFDGDPAEGAAKQLEIKYRIDGQAGDVTLSENDPVVLPTPK
ncbi:MAG: HEAT repeat domain-containing protein, partial [Planctomycetota bacterium]